MTSTSGKPVVVYGASGYTGRLICEYLREYNLPFVAAGRDKTRVQEVVERIPGIDDVRSMICLEEIKPPSPLPVD